MSFFYVVIMPNIVSDQLMELDELFYSIELIKNKMNSDNKVACILSNKGLDKFIIPFCIFFVCFFILLKDYIKKLLKKLYEVKSN